MMYRISLLTILSSFLIYLYFTRLADIVRLLHTKIPIHKHSNPHIRMPIFPGAYFLHVCNNVHGRVIELRLSRCLVSLSVYGEAGRRDDRASVAWPMCTRPRVYITYMCMNLCVNDAYAFNCLISQRYAFLVFDITKWYWISTILATKRSFTCAYLVFTWFYMSFIAFIIYFYCLYVSMLCQQWRNKAVKSYINYG